MDDIGIINTVGYTNMNSIRERIYCQCKEKGYKVESYVSPNAVIYANEKDIGEGNLILPSAFVGHNIKIGNNNIIFSGVNLTHEIKIGNNNFFAAGSTIGGYVTIKNNCFLGLNSIIKNRVELEDRTLVGAGAYISHSTEKNSVYVPPKSYKLDKYSNELI